MLLAIKQRVDKDHSPGQFLLTGSANILTAPTIADALTDRTEFIRLHPFTQGELRGRRETFIDSLFAGSFPQLADQPVGRPAYAQIIAAGGYPEAVGKTASRRLRFFESYLASSMERDLRDIASLADNANARRLLDALAALSASELNFQSLSRGLGLANNTLRSYARLLETLFLIVRVPAWSNNLLSRTIKAPKAYLADPGMLAFLTGADERRIASGHEISGSFFETFAVTELLRQSANLEFPVRMFHYRDRDQREVDLVIERHDGSIVAIEIKSTASVHARDISGMKYLREKLGPRFLSGALLYTGSATVPLSDRIAAVPLAGLWES